MLLLPLLLACGLLSAPDPAEVEALARTHHDAMMALMPPATEDCDGVDRLIAGEDPRGCRFRVTRDVAEVAAVAQRCARPARRADAEDAMWQAAYGIWTGSPPALSTCGRQIESLSKEIFFHIDHVRPPLPDMALATHGARWHAGVAALAAPDQPSLIRGWLEVERALGSCGALDGPACREILTTRGVADQRIDMAHLAQVLLRANHALDRVDSIHVHKRR